MDKKFELTNESVKFNGFTLYRIKALKDFGDVKKGDLGGYVANECNLSQEDSSWIYDSAKVYGNARVHGNAKIRDFAQVYEDAEVYDFAEVCDFAQVYDFAEVCEFACVCGNALVLDKVCGNDLVE